MKRIPLLFKLLFASMLLGLLVVSCEKDSVQVEPEAEADYVLPAEFDGIFTEAELAEFYAGPTEAMRSEVRERFGTWHRITMLYTGNQLLLPFVDDCANPTPCPTCYVPAQWLGLYVQGVGPGTWYGKGAVEVGLDGVINCFATGNSDLIGWMDFNGDKSYGQLTLLSQVTGQDGSEVNIWRGDVIGGEGIFEGAEGYLIHRAYADGPIQPFVPRPYTGYSIGWMYY